MANGHYLSSPIIDPQPPPEPPRRPRRDGLVVSGRKLQKQADFHEYLDWDKLQIAFKPRLSVEEVESWR
jgi:hypothetical protein